MDDFADQYLFIGGSADGRVMEIPERERAPYRELRKTPEGAIVEFYTKRICYIRRNREYFFALSGIDDETAFKAYCEKRGVKL